MSPVGVRRGSSWFSVLLILAIGGAALGGSAASAWAVERSAVDAAVASIHAEKLRSHIEVLADDTFEGREAGSRGGRAAAGYLEKQFRDAGLKPAGERGGYDQVFGVGYRNLLGILEGSDAQLRDQVIVIGAHYDHVGYGSRGNSFGPLGYIHNGADDNASGTSCLLALVQAFTALPEPPKRTILFAFWDGEEKGLLGSQHWLGTPTLPLTRVVFGLNVDMIGRMRNQRVEVYGTRTARGLRRLLGQQNQEEGLDLDYNWEMKANSDHHPFYVRGIPVLMFHTGLHEDYHRPSDDADKVDADGVRRITRLMFRATVELADADRVSTFRGASRTETPASRDQVEAIQAAPPPRMGARWITKEDQAGVTITGIVAGSPAERGGLRVGDRITRCNDLPVTDADQLRLRVLAAPSPLELVVVRQGQEEPVGIRLPLDGPPVRIGLTWREDDAEPHSVLVTMVVPASAAHQAGVQPRDRIYEINGRRFEDGREFRDLLTSAPSPLELLVERRGRLTTLVLPVLAP